MMAAPHWDALVFFGATGDLAAKKIFPALQALLRRGHLTVPVIGVTRGDWTLEKLRARVRESLEQYGGGVDSTAFARLAGLLHCVNVDYQDVTTFDRLRQALGPAQRPLPGVGQANYLRFRLGPDRTIELGVRAKRPGEAMAGQEVELLVTQDLADTMDPYERLLGDAMRGDANLFVCEEAAEAAWRVVEPILGDATPLHTYQAGTWGPAEAAGLFSCSGGWRTPTLAPPRS